MPARRPSSSPLLAAAVAAVVLLSGCEASSTASEETARAGDAASSAPDALGTPDVSDAQGTTAPAPGPTATGDATPTPPPTPTAAPTPASSAAPAANLQVPARPEAADQRTAAGLEAFTVHWLDLLSYSYEANDLEPLLALSAPGCTFCSSSATAMAQIYAMGWAAGGTTALTGFTTGFTPDASGTYTADVTTTQGEISYFSGEGWLGSSESVPNTPHTLTARYTGGRWQVLDYTTEPAG